MTMERMGSEEGRFQMRQEIDSLEYIRISEELSKLAIKGATIAKQLQREDLSDEETAKLHKEFGECVAEGTALTQKKNQLEARLA